MAHDWGGEYRNINILAKGGETVADKRRVLAQSRGDRGRKMLKQEEDMRRNTDGDRGKR